MMENDIHHNPQTVFTYYIAQSPSQSPPPTPNGGQQPPGLDWTTIIVAVTTGVITGVIAPMINPYMKWYFARKERIEERNERIIQELRNVIANKTSPIITVFEHEYFPYMKDIMGLQWEKRLNALKEKHHDYAYNLARYEMMKKYGIDMDAKMSDEEGIEAVKLWVKHRKTARTEYVPIMNEQSDEIKILMLQAIAALERKWGLVGK